MPRRRLNFAAIRARNDALAWKAIHARPVPRDLTRGLAKNNRPATYVELASAVEAGADYGYAFAHFLDEFYLYRQSSFFAEEPPSNVFDQRQRSFLAAMAEFLCHEFSLPVPAWTDKPEYFLRDEWDWVESMEEFNEQIRARVGRRRERASPEFRRHNILYEGRNLIRL